MFVGTIEDSHFFSVAYHYNFFSTNVMCGSTQRAGVFYPTKRKRKSSCDIRGDWTIFFFIMKFSFFLLHCVPLYVCRLCINYQDLSANLLGVAALRMLLLTFTSRFVIDFLSIRKVIIFSAIATDGRHPLRSRSIHQNAANCMTIRFRYIAQPRGVRKTYCARSRK